MRYIKPLLPNNRLNMLIEKDLKKLYQQLLQEDVVHVEIGGTDVTLRVFDNASKLALSTAVFNGGNFIPKSVRNCISQKAPFPSDIKTYLTVDEGHYQILLNYLGTLDYLHQDSFRSLLENFSWIADEWRLYLEEHGKNDLIYVRVK
jgi:hypothetical protein